MTEHDHMRLTMVEEDGVQVLEGLPDQEFMSKIADIDGVIEACLSERVRITPRGRLLLTLERFSLRVVQAFRPARARRT
jgi:hypothetical protein